MQTFWLYFDSDMLLLAYLFLGICVYSFTLPYLRFSFFSTFSFLLTAFTFHKK